MTASDRGNPLSRVRRDAARGNEYRFRDPRDIEETEPEELEFNESSREVDDPTGCDFTYDSPPVYDEYGDEKWYSWITGELSKTRLNDFNPSVTYFDGLEEILKVDHEFIHDTGVVASIGTLLMDGVKNEVTTHGFLIFEIYVANFGYGFGVNYIDWTASKIIYPIVLSIFNVLKTRGRVFFEDGEKEVKGPGNPIDLGPDNQDPTNPSDTSQESGNCVSKSLMGMNRVSVPFDPGGFGLNRRQNSRSSFVSSRGE